MTEYELKKAQELQERIKTIEGCVDYFSPETNGKYSGMGMSQYPLSESAKNKLRFEKFPFIFKLFTKDKTTAHCELHIKGYFGGTPLEVDKNFVDYCRAYFEKELEKAKEEFASFAVKGGDNL